MLGFWRQGLRKLEALGLPTEEWKALRQSLRSGTIEEILRSGLKARNLLLSQLPAAMDYFTEAGREGPEAIRVLLAYIRSSTVRGWLGLPALDWSGPAALAGWVQELIATVAQDVGDSQYALFGYSCLPDAQVWDLALANAAADIDEEAAVVVDRLLRRGEASVSPMLKANVVLSLLLVARARPHLLNEGESVERLGGLLMKIATPTGAVGAYATLEQELCSYLYTLWRSVPWREPPSDRELAYLARIGAGCITDALAAGQALSPKVAGELADEVGVLTHQMWLGDVGSARQPGGLLRPAWGRQMNYALAYLLGSCRAEELDLSTWASDPSVRRAMLVAGSDQRVAQTYLHNLDLERDWPDSLLLSDIARGIADLLQSSRGDAEWSEEEERLLEICRSPEAGVASAASRLEQLPLADEAGVLRTIHMCFYPTPSWPPGAYGSVEAILSPAALESIGRFPVAYRELVLRLIELLATASGLPPSLATRAREVAFGVPDSHGDVAELIEQQAKVLALALAYGAVIDDVRTWISELGSRSDIELAAVRKGLLPVLDLWHVFSEGAREAVGCVLLALAEIPRYSQLWELRRIRREMETGKPNG